MKVKNGLTLRRLGSRFMIVDAGPLNSDPTAVHTLNETAAAIFSFIAANPGADTAAIARFLTSEFEVSLDRATADASRITALWIAEGLLSE